MPLLSAFVIQAGLERGVILATTNGGQNVRLALATFPRAEMENVMLTEMTLSAIATLAGVELSALLKLMMTR
jgi:hypothetical protein